jgi:nucleoid-associated protein
MDIKEATIHQLSKASQTRGEGSVTRHLRTAPLPIDGTLQNVSKELLAMYATRSNSTGTFGVNPTLHQFPVHLNQYYSGDLPFYNFTVEALALIEHELTKTLLANGGFALFLRYTQNDNDYLMVAMLKLKPGAGINELTLDLEPTLNIDVNLLHEAARINLSHYTSGAQPYLTFIRGKTRAGAVTEYFRTALACENFTSAKFHTDQLIRAATEFVEAREDLTNEEDRRKELISMRARLYDCFSQNKKEVVLQTLAAAVMPEDPENFMDFVRDAAQNERYQISHRFQPDRKTFDRLKRIHGRIGKTITLSFSVEDVQQSRVAYDRDANIIVIRDPSGELVRGIEDNVLTS